MKVSILLIILGFSQVLALKYGSLMESKSEREDQIEGKSSEDNNIEMGEMVNNKMASSEAARSGIRCRAWHSSSQSVSTILVLKTRVGLWPWIKIGHPAFWKKKQGAKNQGNFYSKKEEAALSLLFLNNNDPFFLHPAFCKKQGPQFFKSSRP